MPPKTNEEICEHCRIPQGLCNLLQDIVYDDNTSKRAEMARQFRMDIGMFLTEKDKEREEAVAEEKAKIKEMVQEINGNMYFDQKRLREYIKTPDTHWRDY